MTWESVPWMVGGGAMHSAEIGRVLAYAAFHGNSGVVGPSDLRVQALATPGAAVRVAPGACSMTNRASQQAYQSYAGRNRAEHQAAVTATGGIARNDLVIARVEDPWLAGEVWPDPPAGSENVGPYIFTRVISGVAASVIASHEAATAYVASQGWSAIPLAGIALPINTSAVSSGMITDLRRLANPKQDRRLFTVNPGVAQLTSAVMANWIGSWQVAVPPWAVRAVIVVNVQGARIDKSSATVAGTANGLIRAALGTAVTQGAAYDVEATVNDVVARSSMGAGDVVTVPSAMRGTTQTLTIQGTKAGGNKNIYSDTFTFASVDVEFQEVTE